MHKHIVSHPGLLIPVFVVCSTNIGEDLVKLAICSDQELMKERATTAYPRVPSKSKLLASELPNMETCSSI